MSPAWTPWAVLGLEESASPEDVKAAYRRLARLFHPDQNDSVAATEMMRIVNLAYEAVGQSRSFPRPRQPEPEPEAPPAKHGPLDRLPHADFVFWFGKHKGEAMLDVFLEDPDYLEWISENFDDGPILTAVWEFLQAAE